MDLIKVLFVVLFVLPLNTMQAQKMNDTIYISEDSLKLMNPNVPDYINEEFSKGIVRLDSATNFWYPVEKKTIYFLDRKQVSPLVMRDTSAVIRSIREYDPKASTFIFGEKARNGILIFESKNKDNQFKLNGKIDCYYNGNPIMLFTFKGYKINTVDTAIVRNGEFYFEGKEYLADEAVITTGNYPEKVKSANVILERGIINVDMRDSLTSASGTPLNDTILAYDKDMKDYSSKFDKLQTDLNNKIITEDNFETQKNELINEKYLTRANYVKRNISNVVGEIIFKKDVMKSDIINFPFLEEIYASISDDVKSDRDVIRAMGMRDEYINENKLQKQSVSERYTDFEIQTPSGESRKLSDYVGKAEYLFIDFWASWCGPCIADIPKIKKAYEKYRGKGLEVLGVSIDNSEESWKKALKRIDAPWDQVIVKKNTESLVREMYHFKEIPYSILLDKDGYIIEVGLRGYTLEKILDEKR